MKSKLLFPIIILFFFSSIIAFYSLSQQHKDRSQLPYTADENISNNQPQSLFQRIQQNVVQPTPTPTCNQPEDRLTIPCLRQFPIGDPQLEIVRTLYTRATYTAYLAQYKSEGLNIFGLLTIPKTVEQIPAPAVVFLHGFIPPDQYRTTERYGDYIDYLARNGLVVFKIDYRGHGDSDGEPGGGYFSGDYIIDTLHAIKALQSLPTVNSEKISLWGHSMSGNVSLRTSLVSDQIYKTVIWAGAVFTYADRTEYGINDNSFQRNRDISTNYRSRSAVLYEKHGQFDPENEFWKRVTPLTYLHELTVPIQIHHATDDTVVPVGYATNLEKIMKDLGKPIEVFTYASGGHNLTGSTFSQAMQRTVQFLKE